MSDIAIRVDHLSKLYHISALQQRHDTTSASLSAGTSALLSAGLRDALVSTSQRSSVQHD